MRSWAERPAHTEHSHTQLVLRASLVSLAPSAPKQAHVFNHKALVFLSAVLVTNDAVKVEE